MIITKAHPTNGLHGFVDGLGELRWLASKPARGKLKTMLPKFGAAIPLIPRSQWQATSNRDRFNFDLWILDQQQYGECVGCGWAGALAFSRFKQGMDYVKLSPGCLYAQINGGSDNGAVISDGMPALQQTGTVAYDTVGISPIYLQQLPQGWQKEAARFKLGDAYHCQTFEELATALQLGFHPVYGYMVGDNFLQFDRYGVAGHAPGPGNHCNWGLDLVRLPDNRWAIYNVNSWSTRFGPFGNGCCIIDEQHLFGGGDEPDVCVIQAALPDPAEVNGVPSAKTKEMIRGTDVLFETVGGLSHRDAGL